MSKLPSVPGAEAEPGLTTQAVAELLGISRQAVSKRVQAGDLLGYKVGRSMSFPAWQFDTEQHAVRPEIAELLAAIGDDVDHRSVAAWLSAGFVVGSKATPLELLLSPQTKDELIATAVNRAELREQLVVHGHASTQSHFMQLVSEQRSAGAKSTESAILWAAVELFALHGPAKVSLRAVAAAAGVSYGLIYRFYRSKENLLSRVVELFVEAGNRHVADQPDIYTAIEDTFGADEGRWGRIISWAVLDGVSPADFFRNVRGGGYRRLVEQLWANPVPPPVRQRFDPHVISELISLVNEFWTIHEPYLAVVGGPGAPPPEERRTQVIEALQLLAWVTRPHDEESSTP